MVFAGLLAIPPAWAAPVGAGTYLNALVALVLILAGFVAVAWAARRWLPRARGQGVITVVASTAVGPRERVVVVEIAETWLVLGVGAGQVRTLHQCPKPVASPSADRAAAPSRPQVFPADSA